MNRKTQYKIPYPYDRLNTKGRRNIENTHREAFNCGGFALHTYSWYCPFSRTDNDLEKLYNRFNGDYQAVLDYTVKYMLKDFRGRLRIISALEELQENEQAVAYRIETNCWDFHYLRRITDDVWCGKLGRIPDINFYTKEEVFNFESKAWHNGRYDSEMILFALIVK